MHFISVLRSKIHIFQVGWSLFSLTDYFRSRRHHSSSKFERLILAYRTPKRPLQGTNIRIKIIKAVVSKECIPESHQWIQLVNSYSAPVSFYGQFFDVKCARPAAQFTTMTSFLERSIDFPMVHLLAHLIDWLIDRSIWSNGFVETLFYFSSSDIFSGLTCFLLPTTLRHCFHLLAQLDYSKVRGSL